MASVTIGVMQKWFTSGQHFICWLDVGQTLIGVKWYPVSDRYKSALMQMAPTPQHAAAVSFDLAAALSYRLPSFNNRVRSHSMNEVQTPAVLCFAVLLRFGDLNWISSALARGVCPA